MYQFYDNAYYDNKGEKSWILDGSHPMHTSWNIKYASEGIIWIIVVWAMYLISLNPTRINKLVIIEYFLYRILDVIFYFWNFKTTNYWYVYLIIGTIIAFMYLKNHATKNRNEKTNYSR